MPKPFSENAKILIMDEPTSALTDTEIDKLMEILKTLKAHGVTCIYITHKLPELFRITDTVTVLRDGKVITSQPTDQLNEEILIKYMVGREIKERFPERTHKVGKVIFDIQDLHAQDPNRSDREVIKGANFNLKEGEVFGIAGLMGSGRTELVTTLFGEYGKVVEGKITLDGKEIVISNSFDAMKKGISLVPEDRKRYGLVLIQSIQKNITLANLDKFSTWYKINFNAENQACQSFVKKLSIKTPNLSVQCQTLSGGNQQKVVIAKWLMTKPRILIMDDPTRGIDVGAKYEIYKLMNRLAEEGIAIIMISSDLEEVIGMSDRIMVMSRGKSMESLKRRILSGKKSWPWQQVWKKIISWRKRRSLNE